MRRELDTRTVVTRAGLLTLVFLGVAALNHGPVLMPDTAGYLHSGDGVLSVAGTMFAHGSGAGGPAPTTASSHDGSVVLFRSIYYGVPLATVTRAGGVWLAAAVQAAALATLFVLGCARLGLGAARWFWAAAGLTLLAGFGLFAIALLPDVFAGVTLLAVAMIADPRRRLTRRGRLGWSAVFMACLLFHKAFVAIAAILVVSMWLAQAVRRLFRRRDLAWLSAGVGIALIAHAAVGFAVTHVLKRQGAAPPFLMARLADGPVLKRYLDENCARPVYTMCAYRGWLPRDVNDAMWQTDPRRGLIMAVPPPTRRAIIAEAPSLTRDAVLAQPLLTATETAKNMAAQLGTVGLADYRLRVQLTASEAAEMRVAPDFWPQTSLASGALPLSAARWTMTLTYAAGWLVCLALLWRTRARGEAALPVLLLLGGTVVAALVDGGGSGVFERYGGRAAWLLPVGALALWADQRRARVTTSAAAAP